jgi:uncharacterized alkaline shock family protein YloU
MTDTMDRTSSNASKQTGGKTGSGSTKEPLTAPESRGRTTIADNVAAKIAGTAAREVPGIHGLGTGITRTIGGVRDRMPGSGTSATRGVQVEVGEHQAAVDLDVVVDYGVPIADVVGDMRVSVISAMERMTGLEVVEVNVAVDDIDLPEDEDEDEQEREGRGDRVT